MFDCTGHCQQMPVSSFQQIGDRETDTIKMQNSASPVSGMAPSFMISKMGSYKSNCKSYKLNSGFSDQDNFTTSYPTVQ